MVENLTPQSICNGQRGQGASEPRKKGKGLKPKSIQKTMILQQGFRPLWDKVKGYFAEGSTVFKTAGILMMGHPKEVCSGGGNVVSGLSRVA